mmetsp:Transcript_102917/g.266043  ORF Transcript_102917/g.266043 Transcript_102917/m.266043 type:complete len:226 (+) Transcript_102917:279-956(+)
MTRRFSRSCRRQPATRSLCTAAIASGCRFGSPLAKFAARLRAESCWADCCMEVCCRLTFMSEDCVSGRMVSSGGVLQVKSLCSRSLATDCAGLAPSEPHRGAPSASSRRGGEVRGFVTMRDSSHCAQASSRALSISSNLATSLRQNAKHVRTSAFAASGLAMPIRPSVIMLVRPRPPTATCMYLCGSLAARFHIVSVGAWKKMPLVGLYSHSLDMSLACQPSETF